MEKSPQLFNEKRPAGSGVRTATTVDVSAGVAWFLSVYIQTTTAATATSAVKHPQQSGNNSGGQNDTLNQFMAQTRSSIWSLETQIGHIATLMANRAQGNLPSTTDVNPNENSKAIMLRSGTSYHGLRQRQKHRQRVKQKRRRLLRALKIKWNHRQLVMSTI